MASARHRLSKISWMRRHLDVLFERLRTRPGGLAVFALSAALLVAFNDARGGQIQAPAVAEAQPTEHPAAVATVVTEVHVRPGQAVDVGAPLVTLSSEFLERELAIIDAEIERVTRRAQLEQVQLVDREDERALSVETSVAEARRDLERAKALRSRHATLAADAAKQLGEVSERARAGVTPVDDLMGTQWLFDSQRRGAEEAGAVVRAEQARLQRLERASGARGQRPLLAEPTAEAYRAELRGLEVRRRAIFEDLRRLTVVAGAAGRVVSVLPAGSAVARGASVASVLPHEASEIVAFLSPETSPSEVTSGTTVRVTGSRLACAETARVLRCGAGVQQAPGQLTTLLRAPVYGTPLYVSVPEGCSFGAGQVLSVHLDRGAVR